MLSLGSFIAGAVAAALARVFTRPLIVTTASYGYGVSGACSRAWTRTRNETAAISDEAKAMHQVRQTQSTIAQLRRELADLRAELAA